MIHFACPTCAAEYAVEDDKAGEITRCGSCGGKFAVPAADAGPAARPRARPVADADDDRPSRRPVRSRRRDEDDDDEYDDRPRRRRSRYRDEDDDYRRPESKRVAAALLALFLGGWGVHKFYLGDVAAGVIMMTVWVLSFFTGLLCFLPFLGCMVVNLIALVEGIVYLCMSDRDFIRKYQR